MKVNFFPGGLSSVSTGRYVQPIEIKFRPNVYYKLHWSTKKCQSLKISYFLNFGVLIQNPPIFFDKCTRFHSVASFAFFFGQKLHFRKLFYVLKLLKTFLFQFGKGKKLWAVCKKIIQIGQTVLEISYFGEVEKSSIFCNLNFFFKISL